MTKARKNTGFDEPDKASAIKKVLQKSSHHQRVVDVDDVTPEFDLPAPPSAASSTTAKSASSSEAADQDVKDAGCASASSSAWRKDCRQQQQQQHQPTPTNSNCKFAMLRSLSELRSSGLFCDLAIAVSESDERCFGHQVALAAADPDKWDELVGATASSSSSSSSSSPPCSSSSSSCSGRRRDLPSFLELRAPTGTTTTTVTLQAAKQLLESFYPAEAAPTKRTRGKVHGAAGCRVTLFFERLNKLRECGDLCDINLLAGGQTFAAHVPILAAASSTMRDYLLEKLEEEPWPGEDPEVRPFLELSFDKIKSPETLGLFLDFLYCKEGAAERCESCPSVSVLQELASLAEAFELHDLADLARARGTEESEATKKVEDGAAANPPHPGRVIDMPETSAQPPVENRKVQKQTTRCKPGPASDASAKPNLRGLLDKNRALKLNGTISGGIKAAMANCKPIVVQDADISCGDVVKLKGLEKRPDLNGKMGRSNVWNLEEERWQVSLFDGQEVCVRPINLEKVPALHPGSPQGRKRPAPSKAGAAAQPKRARRK
eukprot:CAMPEP_0206451568 /NCGR_PEP_ID=MMETSP0324_2-20121206/19421_1 /ASSEMBLY_ACC=CAM_ASM_000836 /TAXON_ID=2866 /ORGANISM="Crypthecodinium cohnii, Strain Seligo" /LENGTH=548 /DNA_ID=CAMNT_0053921479 /DNA_START=151 /DNA_END=1797 /DNA_ORIENTATION=+